MNNLLLRQLRLYVISHNLHGSSYQRPVFRAPTGPLPEKSATASQPGKHLHFSHLHEEALKHVQGSCNLQD